MISEDLPRSKKTIRKWCRFNHVEKKENVIPGGAKWLIIKSSLDARIAEERLIDASLTHETGPNQSEPVPAQTGSNLSAQVRDDELVEVLKDQLTHERDARRATDAQNKELLRMYHEISLASTQVGIEIGKGMQEQAKVRQLATSDETSPRRSNGLSSVSSILKSDHTDGRNAERKGSLGGNHFDGDNPPSDNLDRPVQ